MTAAAAPDRVVLGWIDHPIAPPPATTSDVADLSVESARHLARTIAGDGYGLPFSVMFDARGKACAIWRAPLQPDDLPVMRARCSRAVARAD